MLIGKWANKRHLGVLAGAAALGCMMVAATPAQAWWRGGVFIGLPPVVVGPPLYTPYYYPPYYPYAVPYYPPPVVYAPPASAPQASTGKQISYGTTCYAGVYVCAAPGNTAVGAGCSCPGWGAPSFGSVR